MPPSIADIVVALVAARDVVTLREARLANFKEHRPDRPEAIPRLERELAEARITFDGLAQDLENTIERLVDTRLDERARYPEHY